MGFFSISQEIDIEILKERTKRLQKEVEELRKENLMLREYLGVEIRSERKDEIAKGRVKAEWQEGYLVKKEKK